MKLEHPCDVCFRHSALISSGTSDMPMAKERWEGA
jgi:NCAIR mutase (PurE)-related protein